MRRDAWAGKDGAPYDPKGTNDFHEGAILEEIEAMATYEGEHIPNRTDTNTEVTLPKTYADGKPTDAVAFERFELLDDEAIVAELEGAIPADKFFYAFQQGGKTVVGMTKDGVMEAVRRGTAQGGLQFKIADMRIEQDDEAYMVTCRASVTYPNGGSYEFWGSKRQEKCETRRDGNTLPDRFAFEKATSKAQRNGYMGVIPKTLIELIYTAFLTQQGGRVKSSEPQGRPGGGGDVRSSTTPRFEKPVKPPSKPVASWEPLHDDSDEPGEETETGDPKLALIERVVKGEAALRDLGAVEFKTQVASDIERDKFLHHVSELEENTEESLDLYLLHLLEKYKAKKEASKAIGGAR